jgi:putative exosortase-associated protein (TIGR04073 family)
MAAVLIPSGKAVNGAPMTLTTRVLLAFALLLLISARPAAAQTAVRKMGRGLANMTTSFLEIPGQMVKETRAQGAGIGIPFGFAKGLGMIVPRVLVGVYEFLSAPFPAPAGYRPILNPEFPWDYFEDTGSAAPPRKKAG